MPSDSSPNPPLSVTPSLGAQKPPDGGARWTWLLLVIYFISGMTGLAYEVLWARMLSLQFGVSIFGVVITVAAFMMGLGGGSLLGARWARRSLSPLLVFAALEGGVGLYALSIPWLQQAADGALGGGGAQASLTAWYALQGGVALLLLFVPALALGASFPLMLKALKSGAGPVSSLARMYGLNALGGALGALLPLLLLPVLGWSKAIYVVAGISLCVAATAFLLSLRLHHARQAPVTEPIDDTAAPPLPIPVLSLLAYGGVGAAALMLQVGWTRLFGMILLRTEYVLAVLLAVFLVGIGVGSLVVRPGKRAGVATVWFATLPVLAGGMSVL